MGRNVYILVMGLFGMDVPDGFTPVYRDGEVVGGYGNVLGPVVSLSNRGASDLEKTWFEARLRCELSGLLEGGQPVVFR